VEAAEIQRSEAEKTSADPSLWCYPKEINNRNLVYQTGKGGPQ
jgi:hypothetical protein